MIHSFLNSLQKKLNIVNQFVLILILSPFIFLALFNHPSSDDFCYASSPFSVWEAIKVHYFGWSGRYFSVFILKSYYSFWDTISTYKYMPLFLLIFTFLGIYQFMKALAKGVFSKSRLLWGALAVEVCYLLSMPATVSGFYWVNAAYQYQVSIILCLFFLSWLIQPINRIHWYQKMIYTVVGCLFAIAIAGSNEIAMVISFSIVVLGTLRAIYLRDPHLKFWIILCSVTIVFTLIVILAPGNSVRSGHFPERHQFWLSALNSVSASMKYIYEWSLNPVLLSMGALFLPFAQSFAKKSPYLKEIKKRHILFFLAYWFGTLSVLFFVSYFSMDRPPASRTMNVLYFFFLIGWFIALFGITQWISNTYFFLAIPRVYWVNRSFTFLASTTFLASLLINPHFSQAVVDLTQKAYPYHSNLTARYQQIDQNHQQNISQMDIIPTQNPPSTIFFEDIRKWSVNCYNRFFDMNFTIVEPFTDKS